MSRRRSETKIVVPDQTQDGTQPHDRLPYRKSLHDQRRTTALKAEKIIKAPVPGTEEEAGDQ